MGGLCNVLRLETHDLIWWLEKKNRPFSNRIHGTHGKMIKKNGWGKADPVGGEEAPKKSSLLSGQILLDRGPVYIYICISIDYIYI